MVLAAAALCHAQEAPDLTKLKELSIEQIMEIQIPTVYGASRHEEKITDAPSSVTIVTREEIQAYGHRTLADILRSTRDFYVTYDRNYSFVGVRGFNRPGDYGGRILLLVDGHRVNDAAYDSASSGYDFLVDVDMIERVEIIRGPGSSLYGSNAFFAVIDVITRKASDLNGAEASAQYGSFNTAKSRFSYGKVFENGVALTLSGSAYDSAGGDHYFEEFDQRENNRGVARGRDDERAFNLAANLSFGDFSLQSGYVWRRKDIPTASYETIFNHPKYHTVDERFFTRLNYDRAFDDGWEVRGAVYWDAYRYHGDYPYAGEDVSDDATIFRDEVDTYWWGAELQVSKQIFTSHLLTLGGEYRDNSEVRLTSYYVDPYVSFLASKTASRTFGVYLQDEWQIMKNLRLNAGIRYDVFSKFENSLNPRLALIWQATPDTTVKLLYGQAFRVPNAFESAYEVADFRVNPNLGPEEIHSYEVVIEQTLGKHFRFSGSIFHNQIDGLISEAYDDRAEVFFFANGPQVEAQGVSLELEAKLHNGIRGRASYTFQQTSDILNGNRLSNSPEHLAKLNLIVPLYENKVLTGLELQYMSDVVNTRNAHVPGSVVMNWNIIAREFIPGLETSLGVYNLFDTDYSHAPDGGLAQDRIQQDGRTFRLKFNYRF